MQNLLQDLVTLLEQDDRLVIEGQLLKNKVIELALALDSSLIRLLLSSDGIRRHFFQDVDGVLVFDKIKFQQFVSNKAFLPDSYTAFKNKIGLTAEGAYLTDSKEFVLAWPYKDCVLEGGQTKQDAKRNEVFWNETLAPDQIDRLLAPKVLTNFKKFDKHGEHKVQSINPDDSLIIKGNNLLVLHTLARVYGERVKLIYIDPPYNRGDDDFTYNDSFFHSTWLTFMRNRLNVAKGLLSNQGTVFVQADDNEHAYLKVLMDEVFGRDNFLGCIAYERSGVSGLGQGGEFLVNTHEFILVYAKDGSKVLIDNHIFDEEELDYEVMKRYNKYLLSSGKKELFKTFTAPSTGEEVRIYKHADYSIGIISLRDFKKRHYEILEEYKEHFDTVFRNTSVQAENEFQNRILGICGEGLFSAEYLVSRGKNKGQTIISYYLNKQVFAWLKDTATEANGTILKKNRISQFWTHKSIPKADLANEGGVKLNRGKKPENLLNRIISMATKEGELVLDFFSGSGSTAAVAHKRRRKFIAVEQLDYGENDSVARMRNVVAGDSTGISKAAKWAGGGSFNYCELAKANQSFLDRIQEAKTTKVLQKLWEEMQEKAFLSYRIDPKTIDLTSADFTALSLDDQKRFLIEVMDKNMLYVPASEMDDISYGISDEDKKLNRQFFGES